MPFFARQIGRSCSFCHTQFPKLKEAGRIFRANGYRFEDEGEWKEVEEYEVLPAAFEVEVEGKYDRTESSGARSTSSDMVIEEVEVMAGGAIGESGRVSALAMLAVAQGDSGGTATYETTLPSAFIQVNDLIGPRGSGLLNLRAGQGQVALPHSGCSQKVIHNAYFAESTLGLYSCSQRLVELNGSVVTQDEESWSPTHRYSAGVTRENVHDDDRLKGAYASYSLTFKEIYTIGAIYRYVEERDGPLDGYYNRYGASAEAEAGPFVLSAGYFRSDRVGSGGDSFNYVLEGTWSPGMNLTLGARYDIFKTAGKKGARSQSYMLRYDIMNNVYTQIELRTLDDDDHATGSAEGSTKGRFFLVALF